MTARLGTTEQPAQAEQDCSPALGGGEQPRSLTAGSVSDDGPPRAVSVLWERIAVEVAELGARPTQQTIADRLGVSRASVQRAIAAHRDAWNHLIGTDSVSMNGDGPRDRGG
jgi:DNA-directed RNA polymerase subunit N (RpoN/RPB10)